MINLLSNQAESYSRESFECGNCNQQFESKVITWVDITKTPQARQALLKWQFNIIQCTHCGCRHFSRTPFFFEDFEEGLLIAVFPAIPDKRGEVEQSIREKYGYYPLLEFFYDMTQIWMLLYFQEHYKTNKNLRKLSHIGDGEKRILTMLRFLKENPVMIDIREKLTETFFGNAGEDELLEILGRAIDLLEEMFPWPRDGHCVCGSNLAKDFSCCGKNLNLAEHEHLLSQHYVVYCPTCKEALSGASCEHCGRVYTWEIGTVESYRHDSNTKTHTASYNGSPPSSHSNKPLS